MLVVERNAVALDLVGDAGVVFEVPGTPHYVAPGVRNRLPVFQRLDSCETVPFFSDERSETVQDTPALRGIHPLPGVKCVSGRTHGDIHVVFLPCCNLCEGFLGGRIIRRQRPS